VDPFLVGILSLLLIIWIVGIAAVGPRIVARASQLGAGSSYGWELLVVLALLLVYGLVVVWALVQNLSESIPHRGRGPIRLDLSPAGFSLIWANGWPVKREWTRLRRPVVIEDYTELGPEYGARVKVSWLLWAALTREATAAMLHAAELRGMVITSTPVTSYSGRVGRRIAISAART